MPEVLFEPNLFLSPHVFLLAILFRRCVFRSNELNDYSAMLAKLKVVGNDKQLPLPLNEDVLGEYLFRGAERDPLGGYVPFKKPMIYSMINSTFKRIANIVAFESAATSLIIFFGTLLVTSYERISYVLFLRRFRT